MTTEEERIAHKNSILSRRIPSTLELYRNLNLLIDYFKDYGWVYIKYSYDYHDSVFGQKQPFPYACLRYNHYEDFRETEIPFKVYELLLSYKFIEEDSGNFETQEFYYYPTLGEVTDINSVKLIKDAFYEAMTPEVVKYLTLLDREKKLKRVLK